METHTKQCEFCHAEEGKSRPIGGYIVKLQTLNLDGATKRVCQSCAHKHHKILQTMKKERKEESQLYNSGLLYLKKLVFSVLHFGVMFLVFSGELLAQPPGMPGSPDQSPIDGGLGLLAALGGAYALKKLKEGESKK